MPLSKQHLATTILASIFLVIFIIDAVVHLYEGWWWALFWFCHIALILSAGALFFRSTTLVYLILSTAIVVQTPWLIDTLAYYLFDTSIFSAAHDPRGWTWYMQITNLITHVLTMPLLIASLCWLSPQKNIKKIIIYLIIIATLFYFVSLQLPYNINCVQQPCIQALEQIRPVMQTVFWLVMSFFVPLLVTLFIVKPLHKHFHRSAHPKRLDNTKTPPLSKKTKKATKSKNTHRPNRLALLKKCDALQMRRKRLIAQ